MIQEFAAAWGENQAKLKEYISKNPTRCYDSYKRLLESVFNEVINPYLEGKNVGTYDVSKIVEIDHGDYQGCFIYIIPMKTYQPTPDEYIITYADYGSCSGCDTLQHILGWCEGDDERPNEEQTRELMQLCLNLLQRCKQPYEEEYWQDDVD